MTATARKSNSLPNSASVAGLWVEGFRTRIRVSDHEHRDPACWGTAVFACSRCTCSAHPPQGKDIVERSAPYYEGRVKVPAVLVVRLASKHRRLVGPADGDALFRQT